jgi:hypothetical protein
MNDSRAPLLIGLWLVAGCLLDGLWRDRLHWDRASGRWRLDRGLGPLSLPTQGTAAQIAGLSRYPTARLSGSGSRARRREVWATSMAYRDEAQPPVPLIALDLPRPDLTEAEARAFVGEVAAKLGLPLLELAYPAPLTPRRLVGLGKAAQAAFLVLGVVTFLNAYADGIAVVHRWTDARGTRLLEANNWWHMEQRAVTSDGREGSYSIRLYLFGSASSSSNLDLLKSAGPSTASSWSLGRCSTTIDAFERERSRAAGVRQARAVSAWRAKKASQIAEAERFLAGLPRNASAAQLNAAGDRFQGVAEWERAIALFRRALSAGATPREAAYANLSIAFCDLAQEREPEAVASLEAVLKVPGCPETDAQNARRLLGRVRTCQGTLHHRLLTIPGDHFPGEEFAREPASPR